LDYDQSYDPHLSTHLILYTALSFTPLSIEMTHLLSTLGLLSPTHTQTTILVFQSQRTVRSTRSSAAAQSHSIHSKIVLTPISTNYMQAQKMDESRQRTSIFPRHQHITQH
jgi:hypothetical protein